MSTRTPGRQALPAPECHRPEANGRPGGASRTAPAAELRVAVPEDLIAAVAERVVDHLADRLPTGPAPWLDVDGAAEYLACEPQRIYDLTSQGRLRAARDGRRRLFRREWLDAYLLGEEV